MAESYQYLTLGEMRTELLARLQDNGAVFTTETEADLYLNEGLRLLNAITAQWNTDYEFRFNPGDTWKTLNVEGSPRERTVTDTDIYTQVEFMLLEPDSGAVWAGTSQFNLTMMSASLQYRRDELLLECAANPVMLELYAAPLFTRTFLPDSTLDLLRLRWIPQDSSMPYVLGREDANTANAFAPWRRTEPGAPESWMLTDSPPLGFDCSRPPNQPGTWDTLISFAGGAFNPPHATSVTIPDDWTPALVYGVLADLLASSPEGRDLQRAKYCLQRYEQLKKAILKIPWLLEANIASLSVDTPSYVEIDAWMQNWEQRQPASDPQIVVGGIDWIALAPFASSVAVDAVLTVVGNAPFPAGDSDFVQLSRDGVDAVLAYAQHTASFKMGGSDFAATMPLLEQFEIYCRRKNTQYAALGIFRPQLLEEGNRADDVDPRFTPMKEPHGKTAR